MLRWLRNRRRRKLLSQPTPPEWDESLWALPFYGRLPEEERAQLSSCARVILAEKHWEGCGGLRLTPRMQHQIAGQAALLLLRLEHEYYRQVRSIFVYPSAYRTPHERVHADGSWSTTGARAGEAWYRGPVVLAWDAVDRGIVNPRDGRNVVIHEFAHQLDFLDGSSDGTPPLEGAAQYASWREVMTERYTELYAHLAEGARELSPESPPPLARGFGPGLLPGSEAAPEPHTEAEAAESGGVESRDPGEEERKAT